MMLIIENVTGDTGLVVAGAEEDVPSILGIVCAIAFDPVVSGRVPVLDGDLGATVILIELKVHHPGNRIRAVGGRSAIFQNLNALNRCDGNGS